MKDKKRYAPLEITTVNYNSYLFTYLVCLIFQLVSTIVNPWDIFLFYKA